MMYFPPLRKALGSSAADLTVEELRSCPRRL